MKILRNKKILILSIIAIALLTLTIGVSYAYFTATVTGNDSAVVTKIVAGILDVDFTITDRISNDNILLIKDEKREEKAETLDFTVSNNGRGTLDAVYYVYLTDVNITNNLKSPDFKWELIKNDETVFIGNFSSAETNTDFTITSETNNGIVIPVKQELPVGQIDRYKLRIWLSETEGDQNSLLNGSFSGKVRVTSTQLTGTEKYVVFKDQSGTQLGKKIISDGKTNYTMDISSVNLTGSTNIYCNNGGIPTISNNTLSIDGVTNNTECKISNDIMDTIANLPNTKTGIVMTNNQSGVTYMNISTSKEVVLDLNGKSIEHLYANETSTSYNGQHKVFTINGSLTINDSVGAGGIYTSPSDTAISVVDNSNVTINGGTFNGRMSTAITGANATLTINGGTFESKYHSVIYQYDNCQNCNVIINGGTFNYNTEYNRTLFQIKIENSSSLTINGGTFTSTSLLLQIDTNNKGTINVNGGTFTSTSHAIKNNSGTINISGGDFSASNATSVYNNTDGIMNIAGGYFESVNNYAINNVGGTTNVTGGTFISQNNNTIVNSSNGTINITQTNKPIYISSLVQDEKPAISNNGGSTINIVSNRANSCTNNINDTTSGLCVYAEGDGSMLKSANRAISNAADSTFNINGGTYYGGYTTILNIGIMNIKNASIVSPRIQIGAGNSGTTNICSSNFTGSTGNNTNIYAAGNAKIYYTSDVYRDENSQIMITADSNATATLVNTCPW